MPSSPPMRRPARRCGPSSRATDEATAHRDAVAAGLAVDRGPRPRSGAGDGRARGRGVARAVRAGHLRGGVRGPRALAARSSAATDERPFQVRSTHSELVDPFRSGVPGIGGGVPMTAARRDRGSVLMLMPAGVLVVLLLGAIAFDLSRGVPPPAAGQLPGRRRGQRPGDGGARRGGLSSGRELRARPGAADELGLALVGASDLAGRGRRRRGDGARGPTPSRSGWWWRSTTSSPRRSRAPPTARPSRPPPPPSRHLSDALTL